MLAIQDVLALCGLALGAVSAGTTVIRFGFEAREIGASSNAPIVGDRSEMLIGRRCIS
jgi:hypothetical protein